MESFSLILGLALAILILGVAAVAFGAESREWFTDERFRPSFD